MLFQQWPVITFFSNLSYLPFLFFLGGLITTVSVTVVDGCFRAYSGVTHCPVPASRWPFRVLRLLIAVLPFVSPSIRSIYLPATGATRP